MTVEITIRKTPEGYDVHTSWGGRPGETMYCKTLEEVSLHVSQQVRRAVEGFRNVTVKWED